MIQLTPTLRPSYPSKSFRKETVPLLTTDLALPKSNTSFLSGESASLGRAQASVKVSFSGQGVKNQFDLSKLQHSKQLELVKIARRFGELPISREKNAPTLTQYLGMMPQAKGEALLKTIRQMADSVPVMPLVEKFETEIAPEYALYKENLGFAADGDPRTSFDIKSFSRVSAKINDPKQPWGKLLSESLDVPVEPKPTKRPARTVRDVLVSNSVYLQNVKNLAPKTLDPQIKQDLQGQTLYCVGNMEKISAVARQATLTSAVQTFLANNP